MFVWQIPHSLAIAQMYRDDYARAGLPAAAGGRPRRHEHARQISRTRWRW
jgi:heme O synthase-like polyprenyltransferase